MRSMEVEHEVDAYGRPCTLDHADETRPHAPPRTTLTILPGATVAIASPWEEIKPVSLAPPPSSLLPPGASKSPES